MSDVDILLLGLGLAAAVWFPIEVSRRRRARARRTRRVEGVVVGAELHHERRYDAEDFNPGTYHARVRFEVDGQTRFTVAENGVSWRKPMPGQRVEVLCDPHDPANAEVVSTTGRLVEDVVTVALPLCGVAMLVVFAARVLL